LSIDFFESAVVSSERTRESVAASTVRVVIDHNPVLGLLYRYQPCLLGLMY
jgi:hypothetical protein